MNRIEPFARKDRGKRRYGILRKLFTAFSSEPGILGLANASSNVIEIHGMQRAGGRKEITESKLVLKHSEGEEGGTGQKLAAPYTEHTPSLLVSCEFVYVLICCIRCLFHDLSTNCYHIVLVRGFGYSDCNLLISFCLSLFQPSLSRVNEDEILASPIDPDWIYLGVTRPSLLLRGSQNFSHR